MTDQTPERCLLCAGPEADEVFRYAQPDVYEVAVGVSTQGYARAWVRCRACHFYYSRYARDPEKLDRIYDTAYRATTSPFRGFDAEATFRRVLALPPEQSESIQRAEWLRRSIEQLHAQGILSLWGAPPYHMLDVGGASGVFAYVFQSVYPPRADGSKAGFRPGDWWCEIVDPSLQGRFVEAHGVRYHACRFGAGGSPGGPPDADGESLRGRADEGVTARFHLISMNYLLEHVRDPLRMLEATRAKLADAGLVYIEVPDALAFRQVPPDDDIFNSCHLWMFDPHSMTRLLAQSRLEVLCLERVRSPRGHLALRVLARAA